MRRQPPYGAVYDCTVRMPIIGEQTFMLRVLSRTHAQIVLRGKLNLDEPAKYWTEVNSGTEGRTRIRIAFNEPTLDLLARWRTRIRAVWYEHDGDYAILVIAPPLIPAIRVRLARRR